MLPTADSISAEPTNPLFVKELLDAIPTGVIVTDNHGGITYVNAEIERLFRYTQLELLGKNVDILLPDRFNQHHRELREGYLKDAVTRHMGAGRDLFGRRQDGSEFPLEVGLRPLKIGNEKWVIATIVDITERKKLESRFAKVIEASPYGKLLVDERGIIQLINPSLLNLFGYAKEELIGQSMNILLPERYRHNHDALREGFNHQPSLRAMGLGRDLTGRHKNGLEIPIEIGLSPVDSDAGQWTLAVVTDITERKRMELSLQQANAHMEEFTYVASHDLKSPLRSIGDLVEWINEDLEGNMPDTVVKNIDRIKLRINRMENLIDDLLRYARAGKRTKDSTLIEIDKLIENILDMHPAPEGFAITTHISLNQIFAARTPLETVLRNLYNNALKHHDRQIPPEISISVEPSGSFVLFRISDNGPGIPEGAKNRLFRLFQTLSTTNNHIGGIGLAIAKRMTETHGGKIQLLTNEGQRGAEFQVYWPRFARKDIVE